MAHRIAYGGSRRQLVLAFDVGTTYSGISFSILDPGRVPEIKGVTRFPAHEHISGASKIPTVIYYDRAGKVRAVGAEAMREGIFELAEDEQWIKAEWFKLHLRSKAGSGKTVPGEIPPLPLNKSVVDVFADFLQYLLTCARSYIQDTQANGIELWNSVKDDIAFVLSHPNGWEGTQQAEMRKAAIQAMLVPDTVAGNARLSFVTEGEASLHFSIQNGLPSGAVKNGEGIVIVDAGGGTIDVSSYSKDINASKDTFEEIAAPQCYFNGSVFVTVHARLFLENLLAESRFAEDVDHIVRCFDKTTKPRFRNENEAQYIKFGSTRDNDPACNIRFGQLKVAGSDVALFFEPSANCIIKAVLEQQKTAHKKISHVVLVGGFAASDWLFSKVQSGISTSGLNVLRPENHVNKAVSDGALSFYLDHYVRTRVSRFTYGSPLDMEYEERFEDHKERESKSYLDVSGKRYIRGAFFVILPKNTQVSETKEFRKSFLSQYDTKEEFTNTVISVWCYRGPIQTPKWKDIDPANYTHLCTIDIDLSTLPMRTVTNSANSKTYLRIDYFIVLLFGLTEMKAQVAWVDLDGVEKRSTAKIVYDPEG